MTNNENPTAALLIIGNEILSGRTHDKNTPWIGEHLAKIGIAMSEVRVVPDIEARIIDAINALRGAYTYVFTTGGIGPTHDDITSQTIAKAFNTPWEINNEAYDILEKYYAVGEFTRVRQKMAMIPRGATLIPNPVSAAPGFNIGNVYVMAGVPKIMQAMMGHILPTLKHGTSIISKTLICDLPESAMAAHLETLQGKYPTIDIGSYPRFEKGTFRLSIVLRGVNENILDEAYGDLENIVKTL